MYTSTSHMHGGGIMDMVYIYICVHTLYMCACAYVYNTPHLHGGEIMDMVGEASICIRLMLFAPCASS